FAATLRFAFLAAGFFAALFFATRFFAAVFFFRFFAGAAFLPFLDFFVFDFAFLAIIVLLIVSAHSCRLRVWSNRAGTRVQHCSPLRYPSDRRLGRTRRR